MAIRRHKVPKGHTMTLCGLLNKNIKSTQTDDGVTCRRCQAYGKIPKEQIKG